jgi:hypothetical protein
MIARIALITGFAAMATQAQTVRPAPSKPATSTPGQQPGSTKTTSKGTIPRHTAEPIVIRDGSVMVDIYSTSDIPVVVEKPNTVVANGETANKATFLVPTRVVPVLAGGPGDGRLQTNRALAHDTTPVRLYVYEVQKLEGRKFVPYSELVFQWVTPNWRISPKQGSNPLELKGCKGPVKLYGAWANHWASTCEYGHGELQLRLGSVTIDTGVAGGPGPINLGTGCSEFRIEPYTHPIHDMPFDHPACGGLRLDPNRSYPTVQVKGVRSITAIDVSLAKDKVQAGNQK